MAATISTLASYISYISSNKGFWTSEPLSVDRIGEIEATALVAATRIEVVISRIRYKIAPRPMPRKTTEFVISSYLY
jgi:hypothetical protein